MGIAVGIGGFAADLTTLADAGARAWAKAAAAMGMQGDDDVVLQFPPSRSVDPIAGIESDLPGVVCVIDPYPGDCWLDRADIIALVGAFYYATRHKWPEEAERRARWWRGVGVKAPAASHPEEITSPRRAVREMALLRQLAQDIMELNGVPRLAPRRRLRRGGKKVSRLPLACFLQNLGGLVHRQHREVFTRVVKNIGEINRREQGLRVNHLSACEL